MSARPIPLAVEVFKRHFTAHLSQDRGLNEGFCLSFKIQGELVLDVPFQMSNSHEFEFQDHALLTVGNHRKSPFRAITSIRCLVHFKLNFNLMPS